jgi:hypothetical protein
MVLETGESGLRNYNGAPCSGLTALLILLKGLPEITIFTLLDSK